jgi:hypothetical protein
VTLCAAEEELRALLEANRVLMPARDGGCAPALPAQHAQPMGANLTTCVPLSLLSPSRRLTGAPGVCVLSVARGGARDEARGTLLHEAMHGLFYAHPPFAAECWRFWREQLDEPGRAGWRAFLAGLGYDATHEELCVNEFQVRPACARSRRQSRGHTPPC